MTQTSHISSYKQQSVLFTKGDFSPADTAVNMREEEGLVKFRSKGSSHCSSFSYLVLNGEKWKEIGRPHPWALLGPLS